MDIARSVCLTLAFVITTEKSAAGQTDATTGAARNVDSGNGGEEAVGVGIAVGVILAIVVVVAAAIIIVLVLRRRRSAQGHNNGYVVTTVGTNYTVNSQPSSSKTPEITITETPDAVPLLRGPPNTSLDGDPPHVQLLGMTLTSSRGLDDCISVASNTHSREDLTADVFYPNEKPSDTSTFVNLVDLADYVVNARMNLGALRDEFDRIPNEIAQSTVGRQAALAPKNRFRNIFPYDFNRVVLKPIEEDDTSHYINASHITNYDGHTTVIATQGPNKTTVPDFWRLVWQENVNTVVMLTKIMEDGKRKCEDYWPDDDTETYGDLTITLASTDSWPDFIKRNFIVTYAGEERLVTQYQFISWPDHGVPAHAAALLRFRRKVNESASQGHPLLFHCSAGVGRTGTFIALERLIQQAEAEDGVNFNKCVREIRQYRMNMIQTCDQYEFLHVALLEAVTLGDTTLPISRFQTQYSERQSRHSISGLPILSAQYEMLLHITPPLEEEETEVANMPHNDSKNRTQILPADVHRVLLDSAAYDYINAVYIPSYRKKRGYIATHWPLPGTLNDFWNMVSQRHAPAIVLFDGQPSEEGFPKLIPDEQDDKCLSPVTVTSRTSDDMFDYYDIVLDTCQYANVQELNTKPENTAKVVIFRSQASSIDITTEHVIRVNRFLAHVDVTTRPIVLVTKDGAGASGVFTAIRSLMEMSEVENEVDIFYIVQQIRSYRPEFIASQSEYCHLHDVLRDYFDDSEV